MVKPRTSADVPSVGGFIVLGLLLDGPKSGYELVQLVERSVAQFWPITKPHIYAELPRLAKVGFAEGLRVVQDGAPDKVVFSATATGRLAFRSWLSEAELGEPRLHHPLLLKLFFSGHMDRASMARMLDTRERRIRETLATYAELSAKAPKSATQRRLTVRYGVLRLEAELTFLDEVRVDAGLRSADIETTKPRAPRRVRPPKPRKN